MFYSTTYSSPIGELLLLANDESLISISLQKHQINNSINSILQHAVHEIAAYFENPHYSFTIDITPSGTQLQQHIWKYCQQIPPGETRTYSDLAKQLNTSPRVIGNALRNNPILIMIPCHRVVAKNGIGGFMGSTSSKTTNIKEFLLHHEGCIV